ncbi:MAG: 3-phosphoserine/phosphohydroxythreonine transaminase [Bacteroidales bacterium]|nr:3-phosphoserine/phosphohydroxythreonine transaminase [Bacteroidales bacterium]
MKKHNFAAGPSIIPDSVKEVTAKGILDLNNIGLSVMEISHRSKDFLAIIQGAENLMRELLAVPDSHKILFVHGGASMNFCMIPYNLLQTKAAYLDTGAWSSKAIKEAKIFGEVNVVASSKEATYNYIPKGYTIPADADYFHITTNNTIYGTEIKTDIDSPVPLIADASSDIMSRPMDISKYGMVYGGAQKNVGPAGVAFVIIDESLLGKVDRPIPSMLDYRIHIKDESLYNTPSCLAVYGILNMLKWLKGMGGVEGIHKINVEKAGMLYDEIDRNKLFKSTVPDVNDRSIMNVTFIMNDDYKDKEAEFLEYAVSQGMVGIKGHRSVGGFRASIYNALPVDSVKALITAMKDFEAKL